MSNGTAVSKLDAPSDDEIQQIRRHGSALVAQRKEALELAAQIEGLEWGSGNSVVRGSRFSPGTRQAFATFCIVTRANPMTHVDVLGGRPYLNVNYWQDLATQHPLYHHYEQREIGENAEKQLRAAGLTEDADAILRERIQWNPPAGMASVVVTDIYRFTNQAPIDQIRAGDLEPEPYLIKISECNWAGGKSGDPVGNSNPSLTARSRSFRRAAVKAFSAWTQQYEAQIQRAEEAIEAEFEIITEENGNGHRALAAGPQVVAADGEPERATATRARPLPVEGEPEPARQEVQQQAEEPEQPAQQEFDRDDARKKIMATFNDAGIKDRKAWAKERDLPLSTNEWTREQFAWAWRQLVDPVRDRVTEKANAAGLLLEDLSLSANGQAKIEYLKHWLAVEKLLDEKVAENAPAADDDGDL